MKTFLLSVLAAASIFTVLPTESQAQGRGRLHCMCYELDRRLTGLENVIRYARISRYEENILNRDIRDGDYYFRQVTDRTPYEEQARICSEGNQVVNVSWVRWQGWLKKQRLDPGTPCERGR
jgi:hypothetical protein